MQETFIKLARGGGQQTEAGSRKSEAGDSNGGSAEELLTSDFRLPHFEPWPFTATRHRALDVLRKNRRIVPMTLRDDRPCTEPGPDAALASRDTERSLLALLEALPPNQREVIRLKFQNDLSYREIAEVTQLTETNVGFLLHTGSG